jgi:hypothetical protein
MAKAVEIEVLVENIYLSSGDTVVKYLEGETVGISMDEAKGILKGDKDAERKPRIKILKGEK